MDDFQKYVMALKFMDLVESSTDQNTTWDALYTYIYANFPEPETVGMKGQDWQKIYNHLESQDLVVMFKQNREQILEKLRSIPPVILEVTFPVWIARYLLCYAKAGVCPSKLSTFDEFHRRYGTMVLGACYRPHV